MVKTSRNEMLKLYREVEAKNDELAGLRSERRYGNLARSVCLAGTIGFGAVGYTNVNEHPIAGSRIMVR